MAQVLYIFRHKSPLYFSSRLGRDTYISYNNGGRGSPKNFPQKRPSAFSPLKSQLPPILVKCVKYTPNGSGRDSYVVRNNDDFSMKKVFVEKLREYDRINRSASPKGGRGLKNELETIRMKQLVQAQNATVEELARPKIRRKIEGKA